MDDTKQTNTTNRLFVYFLAVITLIITGALLSPFFVYIIKQVIRIFNGE